MDTTASEADCKIASSRCSETLRARIIALRSLMSRMMPEKKRLSPSTQVAKDNSMGNSLRSLWRPHTSTV